MFTENFDAISSGVTGSGDIILAPWKRAERCAPFVTGNFVPWDRQTFGHVCQTREEYV